MLVALCLDDDDDDGNDDDVDGVDGRVTTILFSSAAFTHMLLLVGLVVLVGDMIKDAICPNLACCIIR